MLRWWRNLFRRRYRITHEFRNVLEGDTGKERKKWCYYVSYRDWRGTWTTVCLPGGNPWAFKTLDEAKEHIKRMDFRIDIVGGETRNPSPDGVPEVLLRAYPVEEEKR